MKDSWDKVSQSLVTSHFIIRRKGSAHMRGMRSFGSVPTCSGWVFSHIERFRPLRMTIRESSSWRIGETFGKHTKSAPLGRGALFVCCGIVDYLIMISSAFPVDYFPVLLSALPVDVPKEE